MIAANHRYPQAAPYYSPEFLAAEAARLRRWTQCLLVTAAGLVVLVVAAVVFLLNQNRSHAPATPTPPGDLARPGPAPSGPGPSPAEARAAPAKANSPQTPVPTTKLDSPAVPVPHQRFLEALGGLSAAHLYQSHLNIGLLADGVEKQVYSPQEAEKMLRAVDDLMNMVDKHLARLAQTGLEPDDEAALDRIKTVSKLLRIQTSTLFAYWTTQDMEQADQYRLAREAAWTGLSRVLGFEDTKD